MTIFLSVKTALISYMISSGKLSGVIFPELLAIQINTKWTGSSE
jgi:hypothetical protein